MGRRASLLKFFGKVGNMSNATPVEKLLNPKLFGVTFETPIEGNIRTTIWVKASDEEDAKQRAWQLWNMQGQDNVKDDQDYSIGDDSETDYSPSGDTYISDVEET